MPFSLQNNTVFELDVSCRLRTIDLVLNPLCLYKCSLLNHLWLEFESLRISGIRHDCQQTFSVIMRRLDACALDVHIDMYEIYFEHR